jgi:hypothetical protein
MVRMILHISFALFAIPWVGAFFRTPALSPFSDELNSYGKDMSFGIQYGQDFDYELVSQSLLNQGLIAVPDEYETDQDVELIVEAPGVMDNDDFDIFEGEVSAILVDPAPMHGEVELEADGSFTYTPDPGFIGMDYFFYRLAQNGQFSEDAVVQVTVLDAEPPHVEWVSPVPNEGYLIIEFGSIQLEAEATDNGPLAGVQFYRWDAVRKISVNIAMIEVAPYRFILNSRNLQPEWNQIFVRAFDEAGNISDSPRILLYYVPHLHFPIVFH